MTPRIIRVSHVIGASANEIFELLASPAHHSLLDGGTTVVGVKKGPERLFLGAKFQMSMKMAMRYSTTNVVVVFEENRAIAWHHWSKLLWRYDLDEIAGGTRVTESFDYDRPWGRLIELLGWPARNQTSMAATLSRLDELLRRT